MPRVRGARAAAATTDDKPAAAASWPRRGRRGASRAVAEAAAGAGGGAPEPTAAAAGGKHPSPPKRVRKGRQPPDNSAAHAVQDTTTAEAEDAADPWPRLPSVVLSQVLALLSDEDVVSVGQTCRPWRRAALHPDVWRRRALDYWPTDPRHPNYGGRWHRNARRFSRVIRFAPCLDTLRCNHGMLPAARKAVFTQSKCQPSALEINGSLVSALKYIKKWGEGLKDVGVVNPSLEFLTAVVALPRLGRLLVLHRPDFYKPDYRVPVLPDGVPVPETLTRLHFCEGVPEDAVSALVRAAAATLRRLTLEVKDPVEQGPWLRALLQKPAAAAAPPLDHLELQFLGVHDKPQCLAFRQSLEAEGLVAAGGAACDCCLRGYEYHPDPHRMRHH